MLEKKMKINFQRKQLKMLKEFKCVVTEKCWREVVKNEPRYISYMGEGGYVKVECKDCLKVHDIWISN